MINKTVHVNHKKNFHFGIEKSAWEEGTEVGFLEAFLLFK